MHTTATPNSSTEFQFLMNALRNKYALITETCTAQQQQRLLNNLNTELFGLAYLNRWMTMGELKLSRNPEKQEITVAPAVAEAALPAGKAGQPAAAAATPGGAGAKDSYAALKNFLASQEHLTDTAMALCASLPLAGAKPALVIAAARNHAEAGGMINEYEERLSEAAKNISAAAANTGTASADSSRAAQHSGGGRIFKMNGDGAYTKRKTLEV